MNLKCLILLFSVVTGIYTSEAQIADTLTTDSLQKPLDVSDSILVDQDSLNPTDSIIADSLPAKRQSTLDYVVEYQSDDSMRVDLKSQRVYLYGNAVAIYGDIELKADFIEISLEASELWATGLPDSTGEIAGTPVFTQGDQTFEAHEMRYNFKSKRGLSKHVKTEESGGYLHGETVKRDTGEIVYIKDGMYTTCEYDDPHFHIHAGKLKVIPKDKIVTGPAYLSIAGVPTPLAVPFGFFPNSQDRANGIIVPTWGESQRQGFYLGRGGYYFGLGDYMDFALTGDIYTRGSWAGYLDSRYAKRYRFNGNYSIEYVKARFSEKGYPDYSENGTYNVRWLHKQDPKANPGSSFSADVNAGSSKNYRNNILADQNNFLRSQLNSSVRYSKSFANTPFSLSVAATGNQNTQTEFVTVKAPQASFNMARIFPFKGKTPAPTTSFKSKAGIDKIGMNASVDLSNELSGREDTLFNNHDNRMLKSMENGVRASSTVSTNIKLLKYITLSPSTTHRLVGTRTTIEKEWNADSNRVDQRRVNGIDGFYDGSASLTLSTVVYGTYQYKSEIIKAMRHQVTPSASISYKPDYSKPFWGYFNEVQSDSIGNTASYSIFEGSIYGQPSAQENGVINLSLNNTFEIKVRNLKDSTEKGEDKKLKLLDAFNFNTNYNLAKDSLNWNPLNIAVRTQVVRGLQVNANATLDPYAVNANGRRINTFEFDQSGKLGRWTAANVAFGYTIQPKSAKKKQEEKSNMLSDANLYYNDFIDFDMPWSATINYNIRYTNNGVSENVSQIIDLRAETNLTRNWRISARTGYDIRENDITFSSFDIYRDLHCWEFSIGFVPFGSRQNYNFQINVKSAILQDLKLNRRRQFAVPAR